ncbi:MAG TPA: leucyl aminopeptidase [Anaeromyxobacter sp.]|nr:leucyl aminopeptidase [Anaeromyxobacter sp.]
MARKDGIAMEATGAPALEVEADALALPVFEEEVRGGGAGTVKALDGLLGGALAKAIRAERFEGKAGQELAIATLGRAPAARVHLLGMGERAKAGALAPAFEPLRAAAGKAARGAAKAGARTLAVGLPAGTEDAAAAARAAAEGAALGAYGFVRYQTGKDRPPGLAAVRVAVPRGRERSADVKDALGLAGEIAAAVAWARDLVNLGPADCTPTHLAAAAKALARDAGLAVVVLGPKEIAGLGMGMFLGVTRGSAEPPRLVRVSYAPRSPAARRRRPIVLVGKAITFDSGGLSLKPTESMVTMNTDMAGSAAVLGAMRVVAALRPEVPVHAVLGACENMPGGRAYKPSDVLVAFDGQTVEITNTDAEGRLVLGDVLAWARKTLEPAAMIDVATLTGACMVALGMTTAGLLGPDGPVVDGVLAAARASGEEVWRLPLVESLKEQLESERADMKNTGERHGGAITAAHFLRAFAKDVPWAHLDIAGPSHAPKERGYVAKGGTGFAVRTLVEFVRAWRS